MKKIIITIDDDGRFVGISTEEVGVETEETKEIVGEDGDELPSQYARIFDGVSAYWTKDSEYNLAFLKNQENFATAMLKARGYVFLNDVYDMIGIPRTKIGQVVGWIYNEEHPNGDNYIDFGLHHKRNHRFVNGCESIAILDFNVDRRNILNLI